MSKLEKDSLTKFFIAVIGIAVIFLILKELSNIFIPFIIAYVIYFTFLPFNKYLRKGKFPTFLIIIIDILIVAAVAYGLSAFIVDSFSQFGSLLPEYSKKLNEIVRNTSVYLNIRDPYFRFFDIQRIVAKLDYKLIAGGIFTSTFSLVGSVLFILFFYVFVVTGHENIYNAIRTRYVGKKVKPDINRLKKKFNTTGEFTDEDTTLIREVKAKENKLSDTFKKITEQIQRYIIAKISINIGAGLVAGVFLYALGVDFALIWGLCLFLFNFIPTIGSIGALVLPALMTLLQFGFSGKLLIIIVGLAVIQTIFFNLIEPKVLGNRLNLNPLLILISVLIWGYVWGVIGMLLAVPLTAVIKIIIANNESENMIFINNLMSNGKNEDEEKDELAFIEKNKKF